ncbi:MAG: hypothetical protein V4650_06715 [Pseudomonadota bacterium]
MSRLVLAISFALAALPSLAAVGTAPEATAVFDTIRSTPAQLKLHCEQLKLQRDSIDAYLRKDTAAASTMGQRINAIQTELVGYKQAFAFYSGKAGDMAFYKTADGKALDRAQKALDAACPKPKIKL